MPAAATAFQGTLTADTTWTAAGGPYVLTGDVTVPAGVTLTITAGTQVIAGTSDALQANYSSSLIEVAVMGRLIVTGTAASPVVFTSAGTGSGEWFGVRITEGSGSRLEHAVIDEALYGFTTFVDATLSDVELHDCTRTCLWLVSSVTTVTRVHGARCGDDGVFLASDATSNVTYSSFVGSDEGADLRGGGLWEHVTLARNDGRGLYVRNALPLTVRDSIIAGNGSTGLYRSSESTSTLTFDHSNSWNSGSATFGVTQGVGTNGNLSIDPRFMSGTDLRLQPASPCRGAGHDGSDLGAFATPVIVAPPPTVARIALTPPAVTLAPGGVTAFSAVPLDAAGNATGDKVTFSVTNPAAGTITPAGLFTAGSGAGAWSNAVTASVGTVSATAHVTIAAGALSQLIVTPGSATVAAGGTLAFTAFGKDPSGSSVAVAPTWLVIKGGGTVSSSGVFTAGSTPGTYLETVQVLANGLSATATIVVAAGPVVKVLVEPVTPLVEPRQRLQFSARALDAHGNDVNTAITWSVDPNIGTIDTAGLFTAASREGDFPDAVTATVRGITGYASVTVATAGLPKQQDGMTKYRTESAGCSCGQPGGGGAVWMMVLLGAGAARRRRARTRPETSRPDC